MKVLIIDPLGEDIIAKLKALPIKVNYNPDLSTEELLNEMPNTEVLILNSKINIDKKLIDAAPNLKLVCRAGVGLDHFDLEYLNEKKITYFNTPGGNKDSVAEQTIGSLLSLIHNIPKANSEVKNFLWRREENRGHELLGKTVGVIGFGNTGSSVARRLSGFGVNILVYDKYLAGFGNEFVKESSMEELFEKADVVSLHIPLTSETKNLGNVEFFNAFRKPIWFLNFSRGPIVNTSALIKALIDNKVLGAAIDVLPNEKFSTLSEAEKAELATLFEQNIIVTPHIGGWSFESRERIEQAIYEQVSAFVQATS